MVVVRTLSRSQPAARAAVDRSRSGLVALAHGSHDTEARSDVMEPALVRDPAARGAGQGRAELELCTQHLYSGRSMRQCPFTNDVTLLRGEKGGRRDDSKHELTKIGTMAAGLAVRKRCETNRVTVYLS